MKRVLASFMFFTRLPLWKWVEVPSAYFSRVVELWPLVGWLTGGLCASVLYLCGMVFTPIVAVLLALVARVLLTGALHEDGLADFFDGFGGGTDRNKILAIMKDSHIGTYGVLGLVLYYGLVVGSWVSIPFPEVCAVVLCADCWSKFCASQLINFLPYARKAEEAKNRTVYERFRVAPWILALIFGLLPIVLMPTILLPAYIAPVITTAAIILYLKHKIGGYTGDCCGAAFLLSELTFYLTASALWR